MQRFVSCFCNRPWQGTRICLPCLFGTLWYPLLVVFASCGLAALLRFLSTLFPWALWYPLVAERAAQSIAGGAILAQMKPKHKLLLAPATGLLVVLGRYATRRAAAPGAVATSCLQHIQAASRKPTPTCCLFFEEAWDS